MLMNYCDYQTRQFLTNKKFRAIFLMKLFLNIKIKFKDDERMMKLMKMRIFLRKKSS